MSNPKIIDLDALVQDTIGFRLAGKVHELKPVTFKDFLENMKDLQKVGKSPSIEEEMTLSKRMLLRAFPTLTEDDVDNLTMSQMQMIVAEAHKFNGQSEGAEQATAEAGKANPPPAA
jgi:hypothetical protein